MKTNLRKATIAICLLLSGAWLCAQPEAAPEQPQEPELHVSPEGGFYRHSVTVELTAPQGVVYYTLDGSTPSRRSQLYRGPIEIRSTTVVRAVAFDQDRQSRIIGHTFFIDEPYSGLAVVSLGVSPSVLFDPHNGIFMQGSRSVDTLWNKPGANFWTRREFPLNVELFETDGRCVYNNLSGFRLFGGMSRLFPQKSLALVARRQYGKSSFDYPLFGDDGPKKFKFLVLRNSGSDFGKTHFRDALMTSLVKGWDLETQAYRPAHVYINGKYWGIYNLREKVNRYFIESHSGVDKDSIDLIEHYLTLKRGNKRHYLRLLDYLETHDLRDPAHFAYVGTQMEIGNYLNQQIAQIYFDNQDAGGNIKFWRPQTPDGRWRWVLFDTDWGMGLHEDHAYLNNSLAFHTKPNGPAWPNPPWSTFLLRKLLENESFRATFVNRFADHLNTHFSSQRVLGRIEEFYRLLRPEMPRHLNRWRLSPEKWEEEVEKLREFARERPEYVRMHLMERFRTGAQRQVSAQATPGGRIVINDNVEVRQEAFEGVYFEHYPIHLRATADYGYRFSHWEGIEVTDNERETTLPLTEKRYHIRAVFEPFVHPLVGKIIINEICPNNKNTGDWIELFNASEKEVSLSGWVLTDLKNEFVLPEVFLDPNDYLVICRDATRFMKVFPEAYHVIGGLDFGLNKQRETLGLFSRLGASVDSVTYEVPPTDSAFVLSLLLPQLNNADPGNWLVRAGSGSPNAPNPYYVESRIRHLQAQWMQIGLAAGVVILCILLLILRHRHRI